MRGQKLQRTLVAPLAQFLVAQHCRADDLAGQQHRRVGALLQCGPTDHILRYIAVGFGMGWILSN